MFSLLDVISEVNDDKVTHRFLSQDHTTKELIFQAFHSHCEVDYRSTSTNLFITQTNEEVVRWHLNTVTSYYISLRQRCLGIAYLYPLKRYNTTKERFITTYKIQKCMTLHMTDSCHSPLECTRGLRASS